MERNPYIGKFIVFEGLDGSGQTTQTGILSGFFQQSGKEVVETKEPTEKSPFASQIKRILSGNQEVGAKELQSLFAEDRRWHLDNVVVPALTKGQVVISDRYFFSSFAYGMAEGLEFQEVYQLNSEFILPDIVFFLDVGAKICIERIKARGKDKTIFEEVERLKEVYQFYKETFQYFREKTTVCYIDGKRPIKEVFEEIQCKTADIFSA